VYGLVTRRTARNQLDDEHLEVLEGTRGQQVLAAEVAELQHRPAIAPQNPRVGPRRVRLEQVGDVHAQRRRDACE